MEFSFEADETIAENVRRIAYEQIDLAVAELHDDVPDRHESIHQVRKRSKKLRALIRLVRPLLGDVYAAENAHFRNAARGLSNVRDATAFLEMYDVLMQRFSGDIERRAFGPIRRALTQRRAQLTEHIDLNASVEIFLGTLHEARNRVAEWPLDGEGFAALKGGLFRTYRRGRNAMAQAYKTPSPETFHEWRKRVKYHGYHVRLLEGSWPLVMQARSEALGHLSDLLGVDHDLAVLRETLADERDRFHRIQSLPTFLALLEQRRAEVEAQAYPLGLRLFADKPGSLTRRFEVFWDGWHLEQDFPPAAVLPRDATGPAMA